MDRIVELLQKHERLTLSELYTPPHTRGRLLGLFLATLELIRGRLVWAEQPESFGDVWLRMAESQPVETASETSSNAPAIANPDFSA
jgi:chromatin segregation and condensation protein Rec8/ScpA/Scc1 (kleisin family)